MYKCAGIKRTFFLTLTISTLSAGFLMVFTDESSIGLAPVIIACLRMGMGASFDLLYHANVDVFPTMFSGSAVGICNFIGRAGTTFAPQIAERPPPLPMLLVVILSIVGIIAI